MVKRKVEAVELVGRVEPPIARPVERQVEARGGFEDGLGSMVRCLHFASTYIANNVNMSPTLWAGTNTGQVLVFMLTITLLPQLKPCGKYKLTAHEGIRVKKTKSATITSFKDAQYTENCLVFLVNSGEVGAQVIIDIANVKRFSVDD